MSPTPDLPDLLRGAVLAVLVLATGYHLVRLLRRPVEITLAAHALMGGVMLMMLAGWVGRGAVLGWVAVFVAVGFAGLFSRARLELLIGCAAMVLMLVTTHPSAIASTIAAPVGLNSGFASESMAGVPAMGGMHRLPGPAGPLPAGGSSAELLIVLLSVVLIPALVAVSAGALLRARASYGESTATRVSPASLACRVGLNVAAVYMLVLMV